jgi:hypothetical protein
MPRANRHSAACAGDVSMPPIVTISLLPQAVDAPQGEFDNAFCVE